MLKYKRKYILNIVYIILWLMYVHICDAIREKEPTIQKIDFRTMRDSISF